MGLLPGQKVVLSVGAINSHHKRIDHVINEVALLDDNFFLIILGQFEKDTDTLIQLAEVKLNNRCIVANLPYEKVRAYYIAADYFVLASLHEGFGRVLVEALSYGLPCIVHNNAINAKQVLHEFGEYVDMTSTGALANYLSQRKINCNKDKTIQAAYNLYSWDVLKPAYVDMILKQIDHNQ